MTVSKKEFKTPGQQLKILHKRGLNVFPVIPSYKILKKTNYYNLINGYKKPFLKNIYSKQDNYKKDSSFMEIYYLYKFDRSIRNLFLEEVLKVENAIKSVIVYHFSKKYGFEDKEYLKIQNFSQSQDNKRLLELNEFICKLMRLIWKQNNVQPYIEHYRDEHKYVPLWVLINSMTFGDTSKFYSFMTDNEKISVAKDLSKKTKILHSDLESYLKMIGVYRNILAHDERFYEYQKKNSQGKPYKVKFRKYLNLGNIDSSVFALTVCLKILLDKDDFNNFFQKLIEEVKDLQKNLTTVSIEEILKMMNFIIPSRNINNLEDIIKLFKRV